MKQDIRDLFEKEGFPKKKLPDSHRDEFLEKLNTRPSKKRNYALIFKIAASVILLLTTTFLIKKDNTLLPIETNVLATPKPKDSTLFNQQELIQKKANKNRVVLEEDAPKNTFPPQSKSIIINYNETNIEKSQHINNKQLEIFQPETDEGIKTLVINKTVETETASNNKIMVNSDALLYSVTHTSNEILDYYKANNLTRESVLVALENELKKSDLDIDANSLLTEIELGMKKYSFKEKLMATIKMKIKELSNTIVNN